MIGDRNDTESTHGAAGNDEQAVSATDLFEVLAEPARRHVLRELHETGERVGIRELADALADGRADRTPGERADGLPDDPDRLAVRLHHCYLPKLDDCGLADYDSESHTAVAEIPGWVEPYLHVVGDE